MTNPKDKVFLDLSDNAELAEHLALKEVGDTCTLTITGTVQEVDAAKLAIIAVEEVSVADSGYDAETESPAMAVFAEPEPAEPIN
jgi:hypothetical protein